MTFGQAVLDSVLGVAVVFFALVLLMCIIKLLWVFTGDKPPLQGEVAAKRPEGLPSGREGATQHSFDVIPSEARDRYTNPKASGTAGELKLYDTPPRTAAMLMAIVADELKMPLNELRFLSIREVRE